MSSYKMKVKLHISNTQWIKVNISTPRGSNGRIATNTQRENETEQEKHLILQLCVLSSSCNKCCHVVSFKNLGHLCLYSLVICFTGDPYSGQYHTLDIGFQGRYFRPQHPNIMMFSVHPKASPTQHHVSLHQGFFKRTSALLHITCLLRSSQKVSATDFMKMDPLCSQIC